MTEHKILDTLTKFHHTYNNFDNQPSYIWLMFLTEILDELACHDLDDEEQAMQLFKFICEKSHVDAKELLDKCQDIANKHVTPRLLLHILLFPISYVAEKLQTDYSLVAQLLDQLHKSFTIDQPILWLKRLLAQILQHALEHDKSKHDQLLGIAIINQPIDTAEERRVRERKLHHGLTDKLN